MPIPVKLENGDSAEYWQGAAAGKLLFQRCRSCQHIQFPPRHHCERCWQADPEWIESSGKGTVESFTIVRRAPLPEFRDSVPYALAAIRVAEGPRMITNVVGDDALEIGIGDPVEVTFSPDHHGNVLPRFRLTEH